MSVTSFGNDVIYYNATLPSPRIGGLNRKLAREWYTMTMYTELKIPRKWKSARFQLMIKFLQLSIKLVVVSSKKKRCIVLISLRKV